MHFNDGLRHHLLFVSFLHWYHQTNVLTFATIWQKWTKPQKLLDFLVPSCRKPLELNYDVTKGVGSAFKLGGGWNLCYYTNVCYETPLLVIATSIIRIMHFTSVKVIWRLLDEVKLFSSINTVARSTFIKVFTSFKLTNYPFTSSLSEAPRQERI